MADEHHYIQNTALPYISNNNPTFSLPCYVDGNNMMTSIRQYAELRYGTTAFSSDDFGSSNTIKRVFTWQTWAGVYYVMVNKITSTQSIVYKWKLGTDSSFTSIFTSSSTEPFDFAVSNNQLFFGNGTDMKKYDGTTVTTWGLTQPSAPTLGTTGTGLTLNIGRDYAYAYGNSSTGHIGPISPTANTGTCTNKTITVGVTASGDSQVDQIWIYATEDGGAVLYAVASSPFANSTTTQNDATTDTALVSRPLAPLSGVNSAPTASKGPVFWNGRIWTFKNDTVYFSGNEEINAGVSEEAFPTFNKFRFGREVTALIPTQRFLLVYTANEIFRISGDSLATFKRDLLASKTGSLNRAAMTTATVPNATSSSGTLLNVVAWLDTNNVVRVTDGVNIQDISIPIRPDIAAITHASASMAAYDDGKHHWIILLDGGAGYLRVYDLDTQMWMPPWSMNGVQSIHYGPIAAGTNYLFIGRFVGSSNTTQVYYMDKTLYTDRGNAYSAFLKTSLMNVVEDSSPSQIGAIDHVGIERNTVALNDVKILTDDDPFQGTYTSVFANEYGPSRRNQGTYLIEKWYWSNGPTCRRASIYFAWTTPGVATKFYTFDVVYGIVSD